MLPGDSWNFFNETISNRIFRRGQDEEEINETVEILLDTIVKKMVDGSRRPFALGISNLADKTNEGDDIDNIKTPFELRFIAPDRVKNKFSDEQSEEPWYEVIKEQLSAGDTIYEVYAHTPEYRGGPDEETNIKIADLVLRTDLETSEWADTKLYFKHKHVHPDRRRWDRGLQELNLDFLFDREELDWDQIVSDYWPTDRDEAKQTYMDQFEKYDCPFAWLLGMY